MTTRTYMLGVARKSPFRFLSLLLVPMLLGACAANPVVRTQTVEVKVPVIQPIPKELTQPVPEPQLRSSDNGGLATYVLALQDALRQANAQLKAIEAASH